MSKYFIVLCQNWLLQ